MSRRLSVWRGRPEPDAQSVLVIIANKIVIVNRRIALKFIHIPQLEQTKGKLVKKHQILSKKI